MCVTCSDAHACRDASITQACCWPRRAQGVRLRAHHLGKSVRFCIWRANLFGFRSAKISQNPASLLHGAKVRQENGSERNLLFILIFMNHRRLLCSRSACGGKQDGGHPCRSTAKLGFQSMACD